MRIPVYPIDLNDRKHGFKRLAKWLFKRMPVGSTTSLMQLQDILAKAFGYQGFHDLKRSAQNTHPIYLRNHPVPEVELAKESS